MTPAIRGYEDQKIRFAQWLHKHRLTHLLPMAEDGLVLADDIPLEKLLPLCLMENRADRLSLHSLWFLEKYVKAFPEKLPTAFDFLLQHLETICIEGSVRILGNILIHRLKLKNDVPLPEQDDLLIDRSFHWLISTSSSVAVVANAIELLYLLAARHSWIKAELVGQIEHLLHQGTTPAIHARGRKVLQQLQK